MKSHMKSENMCLLFLFSGDDYDVDNSYDDTHDGGYDVERKRIHSLHRTMCYFVHERFSPTNRRMIYLKFSVHNGGSSHCGCSRL